MNKQQIAVIERAIHSNDELFPLNKTWRTLHDQYNIGLTQAKKLKLTQQDKIELAELVRHTSGIDLSRHSTATLSDLNREEALVIATDEKLAGQAVKKERLALKSLPGHALKINQQTYRLPCSGHLDMTLNSLASVEHSCLLLIENYRCFDGLSSMNLNLGSKFSDPLVIYRGDNVYSERSVRHLLDRLALPVLVMPDLDPKGLVIAQSFPGTVGLIAPEISEIEKLFNDHNKINPQLYSKQLTSCKLTLSKSPHSLIQTLWAIMQRHQAGLVQEYWLNMNNVLITLDLDESDCFISARTNVNP